MVVIWWLRGRTFHKIDVRDLVHPCNVDRDGSHYHSIAFTDRDL